MDKDYERQRDLICSVLDGYSIIVNRTAIAESILSIGAIIPPVVVDQTLYVYDKHRNCPSLDRIVEVKVYAIRMDTAKNDKRFCVIETARTGWSTYMATFKWDSIGKTIFYTYKEAEDKMNRRKK